MAKIIRMIKIIKLHNCNFPPDKNIKESIPIESLKIRLRILAPANKKEPSK